MPHLFTVPHDHPALPGHFPGQPVVPGVVVLDAVLAAIAAEGHAVGALRLPQVKFVQPLLPGVEARIVLDAQAVAEGAPPRWKFRVERTADDAALASGEVVA
jgi:3-hydroxyacyl-[acyl-carrier-protein] dehydratase